MNSLIQGVALNPKLVCKIHEEERILNLYSWRADKTDDRNQRHGIAG